MPSKARPRYEHIDATCRAKSDCEKACGDDCDKFSSQSYGTCDQHSSCVNWSDSVGCGIPCGGLEGNPGYFCNPAGDGSKYDDKLSSHTQTNYAYGCLDWSFQSKRMQQAEDDFRERTGNNVYFGIGSYGNIKDQKENLGKCYRITASNVDKDLIVQNINSGVDVDGTQFDLQMGAGGFGLYNACASDNENDLYSMFSGKRSSWGEIYGGINNRKQCDDLPEYPRLYGLYEKNPSQEIDSLRDLCKVGFDKNVRIEGGENQTIVSLGEVSCPSELTQITGMKPLDKSEKYLPSSYIIKDNTNKCGSSGTSYCLTRMMDCRKPSASFKDNVTLDRFQDGAKLVQPCGQDGYTRIDNRCGCKQCYC